MYLEVRSLSRVNSVDQKRALSKVLRAHLDCFHYVYIDEPPETLCRMSFDYLNFEERALLRTLMDQFTVDSSLNHHLDFKLVIDFSEDNSLGIRIGAESGEILCSYESVLTTSILDKAHFILEDDGDAHLYDTFCQALEQDFLSYGQLTYYTVNGGGDGTYKRFERHERDGYLILCLLDSDKKHPSGPIGQTAKKFGYRLNEKFKNTSYVELLEHHEIENLVPIKVLIEVTKQFYAENSKYIHNIETLLKQDSDIKRYIDFKKGKTVSSVWGLDRKYEDYWLREDISQRLLESRCKQCIRGARFNGEFKCIGSHNEIIASSQDSCEYFRSYNDRLLEHSKNLLQTWDANKIQRSLSSSEEAHWKRVTKLMLAWFFASRPSITI